MTTILFYTAAYFFIGYQLAILHTELLIGKYKKYANKIPTNYDGDLEENVRCGFVTFLVLWLIVLPIFLAVFIFNHTLLLIENKILQIKKQNEDNTTEKE